MAATIVEAADNGALREHVSELLGRWHSSVAEVHARFGDAPAAAADQATVLLAAIEGALILARARRDTEPLNTVERYFAARPPAVPDDEAEKSTVFAQPASYEKVGYACR